MEILKTNYQDGWIPATEQEPPEDHVLVTLKHSEDDYEVSEIDYGVAKSGLNTEQMRKKAEEIISKIIAWMPLPEPYQEEQK